MTPDNREEQVREALDWLEGFAARGGLDVAATANAATIRAHIEALEANDRRYRVVRVMLGIADQRTIDFTGYTPEKLDAAIDSAMQGEEVRGG